MSLQFDEHRLYLSDRPRLAAFDAAIRAVVRPGDVVADLGCGTGILGLMACRAGAARVYAIDGSGMLDVARQAARANGCADRIMHLHGFSTRLDLPERVDVVVADQIGRMGFEAGVVEYFEDARRRWLKPEGRVVPGATTTWLAPVEAADVWAGVEFWETAPQGFDFSCIREGAANTGYPCAFDAGQLLGAGLPVVTFDLTRPQPASGAATGEVTTGVTRAGVMHGLAGWFTSELAPGITMTNAPGAPDRIFRQNAFLPLDPPVPVRPGDQVHTRIVVRPNELILAWRVTVSRQSAVVAVRQGTTLRGMLIAREDLDRTDPARRPHLSRWADARATVLELCDGRRALRDVEAATAARHPSLFPKVSDAAVFVAEVVTRYGATPDAGA
jgi:protein arginine N-methyltransferase 1